MPNTPAGYPEALQELICGLKALPGIGSRTAERLALALLKWPEPRLQALGECLNGLHRRIKQCGICGNLADSERCVVCANPSRDASLVCVVEEASQIPVIERAGGFRGLYHVLGGRIVPLDGIGPDDLRIHELTRRLEGGEITEIILATSPDVEGEATAAYLADLCRNQGLRITRIATGVPVGADLMFADSATMALALSARRLLE